MRFGIGSWATHGEASIRKAADLGADIFRTDRPDLALQIRDRITAASP